MMNMRFGRLTVIAKSHRRRRPDGTGRHLFWRCVCDCGQSSIVDGVHLRSGHTRSCGCLQPESAREAQLVHGLTRSPEWCIWCGTDKNSDSYSRYGGRGIKIYSLWKRDFVAFFRAVGRRPSTRHTIERIDNSKGYVPGNVCWATAKAQARNRRSNRLITVDGDTAPVSVWVERTKIQSATLVYRLNAGWPHDRVVSERPRGVWRKAL